MAQRNIRLLRITPSVKFIQADRVELSSTPFHREIFTKKFSPLKQEQYRGRKRYISAIKKLARFVTYGISLGQWPRRNLFSFVRWKSIEFRDIHPRIIFRTTFSRDVFLNYYHSCFSGYDSFHKILPFFLIRNEIFLSLFFPWNWSWSYFR